MSERTVLITGATGNQGGALAQHLVGKGFKLRGMTRHPEGDAAQKLAALGVEVVRGDLDDEASLRAALAGAWGVFSVQNTWEAGVDREEEQGKRVAKVARAVGVEHFVYASVGSAHLQTGIPHFDNKARVEEVVRTQGFPSYAILRPVFFMENLVSPWFLQGDKIATAMRPETSLQMVAVEDIGRVAAQLFERADEFNRREIDLAGDSVTVPDATAALSRALGRHLEFVQLPIEAVRQNSEDFALMLEWFERVGYSAKIPELEATFGRMLRVPEWASKVAASAAGRPA